MKQKSHVRLNKLLGKTFCKKFKTFTLIRITLGIFGVMVFLALSSSTYAAGGGGTGGSGSNGSGGGTGCGNPSYPCTTYGEGWAVYPNVKNGGPELGFIDGDTKQWNNMRKTCGSNPGIIVFVIDNAYGKSEGYNYTSAYDTDNFRSNPAPPNSSDDNSNPETTKWAQTYFNSLPSSYQHGTWNQTVGWFCYLGPGGQPTPTGSCTGLTINGNDERGKTYSTSAASINISVTFKNTGSNAWPGDAYVNYTTIAGSTNDNSVGGLGSGNSRTISPSFNNYGSSKTYIFAASDNSGDSLGSCQVTINWSIVISVKAPDINASTGETPASISSGQSATFTHKVSISNDSSTNKANFSWAIKSCYSTTDSCPTDGSAGGYTNVVATGGPLSTSNSTYSKSDNSKLDQTLKPFSSTDPNGAQYCQRLFVNPSGTTTDPTDNYGGNENDLNPPLPLGGWYYDNGECVTNKTLTGGGVTGDCTTGELNTGSDTNWWNGDKTAHYAIFALPAGSSPGVSPGNLYAPSALNGNVYNSSNAVKPNTLEPSGNGQPPLTLTPSQYVSGNVVWYGVIYNYPSNADGDIYVANYFTSSTTPSCFQATCSISVNGTLGGDDTKASTLFSYTVTVTNNGSNSLGTGLEATPSYYTGYTATGSSGTEAGPLDLGGSSTLSFNSTPNDDDTSHILSINLIYQGVVLSGIQGCSQTINDYEAFTLVPTAVICTTNCDEEDPTNINYDTYVINTNSGTTVPVPATTTSSVYYIPAGSSTPSLYDVGPDNEDNSFVNSSSPPPAGSGNYTINPGIWTPPKPYSAGDQYCSEVDITSDTSGYIGPGNNIIDGNTNGADAKSCFSIHNEPYLQVFGNDVIGDAAFSPECGSSGDTAYSGIYTFSQATNTGGVDSDAQPTGSYGQFGAQALSYIEGLSSAGLRPSGDTPNGSMGLSFSNTTDNSGGSADAAELGGGFGDSMCEPNYYGDMPTTGTTPYANVSGNASIGTGNYTAGDGTDTTTISSSSGTITIPEGGKVAIFVNGNAYIDSNIEYAGATALSGGWGTIKDIPSLYIIATGNVYIDPDVTQLDGVYIAQPNTGTATGIIDTCASSTGPFQIGQLYGDVAEGEGCDQQLVVNGAFVDQATMFDRSYSSVRYSYNSPSTPETPQSPLHSCGVPGQDVSASDPSEPTCAAEVFNFSPEVYLSQPAFTPLPQEDEYITSLSPVL